MKRIFALASIAALCLVFPSCNKDNGGSDDGKNKVKFAKMDGFFGEGISEDGSYMAGSYQFETAAIWDIQNEKLIMGTTSGTLHAVNKNGVAAGASDSYAIIYDKDKNVTNLYTNTAIEKSSYTDPFTGELVETEAPAESGSEAYAISEDGKLAAGFFFDSSWKTSACVWKAPFTGANDRVVLPLPSENEIGWMINGSEARWISSDGKTILGWIIDDMGTNPAAIWEEKNGSFVVNPICKAFFDPDGANGLKMLFTPTALSADGNWIGLQVQDAYDPFDWSVEPPAYYGARLNRKTGQFEIMDAPAGVCASISNDGTVAGYFEKEMGGNREPFVWQAGSKSAVTIATLTDAVVLTDYISLGLDGIGSDNSFIAGVANDSDFNTISLFIRL